MQSEKQTACRNMVIRDACIEDVDGIVSLIRCTLPSQLVGLTLYDCSGIANYVVEGIRSAGLGGETRYMVALMDGIVVGAIEVQLSISDIFIKYVAVATGQRRKGIANKLLLAFLEKYPEKPNIRLHVLDSNAAAMSWYESIGLTKKSAVSWYQGDLPLGDSSTFAIVCGYPQLTAHLERFGFGTLSLKGSSRTVNVGLMGSSWFRFTSWSDISTPDVIASLRRIWPSRRALVLAATPCPDELLACFYFIERAHLLEAQVQDVVRQIAKKTI